MAVLAGILNVIFNICHAPCRTFAHTGKLMFIKKNFNQAPKSCTAAMTTSTFIELYPENECKCSKRQEIVGAEVL